ncbi:hypothetical protein CHS0354_026074 [Potamilus streckersoni]|uniref:Uncharacterized protein n=1 Tax=Potamilus streckersoni TaxID=2493646 RepID=A0AAE0VVZ3_9BIVA|nr:hypothetical protein CHS0354_026074 [Potamilus streckersoni]
MERIIRSTFLLTLIFYLMSVTSTYRIQGGIFEEIRDGNQQMRKIPEIRTMRREGANYRTGDGSRVEKVGDNPVHNVFRLAEYKNLRHALEALLEQVNKEEIAIEEKYFPLLEESRAEDGNINSDMSLYSDYQYNILSGNLEKRSHRKRSVFDSIGHSGDFTTIGDRFSSPSSLRSREFTFENLLPILLRMQKEKRIPS